MCSSLILIFLGFGLAALMLYLCLPRGNHPLPPGPRSLPFLGNLFDIPVSHEYATYTNWGKEYGDVAHVSTLGIHIVVLNSFDAANELLHVRSAINSDRPFIPMLHDPSLMDLNWSFSLQRYTPTWRRQRRLFAKHFNATVSRGFFESQLLSAHVLLGLILSAPEDFVSHLSHASAATILAIAYGYQARLKNDPLIGLANYMVENVGQGALPGRFFVNIFPWLNYMPAWTPWSGFKVFAEKCRNTGKKLIEMPFEDAKRRMADGTALPSFVTSALTDPSPDVLITDIQAVAATMYGAATESTSSTIHSCILAFVLYPDVQLRAQAELDVVLGLPTSPAFRLPTFSDRSRLPYIDAIVKESLRWLPAGPIGIPHATMKDDVYRGWRIPKGTIIIANAWSILHDDAVYANPLKFHPERFLGENPAPSPAERGCFGFGRRACPGSHIAEASLWIQIASLLAVFTFSHATDPNGHDIDVSYAREPLAGLLLQCQRFPCKITPRSKEAEIRIHEANTEGEW